MFVFLIVAAVTAVVIVVKIYYDNKQYWKRRGIPGPEPSLFSGNLDDVTQLEKPIAIQLREWTKQFGSVYGFYEGYMKVLVISDPEMVQELFIKKFDHFYGRKLMSLNPDVDTEALVHVFDARGTRWKRLRILVNPAFSSSSLKLIRPTVEDSAREMIKLMEKHVDGPSFNIHVFFQEYTMDVISRIALGQKESTQFHNEFIKDVLNLFMFNLQISVIYAAYIIPVIRLRIRQVRLFLGKFLGNLPLRNLYAKIRQVVAERVKERALLTSNEDADGSQATDLIDMFLDAEVDERNDAAEFSKSHLTVSKTLTIDEVVAQCSILLQAGFDTTANSLAYICYELAKHPEVMKKIQQEIDEICISEDISYEDLSKLKYTELAMKESLRMYPLAAFASSRECSTDTTLGDIKIEKGTRIMADVLTLHYDKKLWGEDANEFKPERWESSDRRHIMSWFPFGAGPRQCVGMRLALMEEKLALAHILRRFDIVAAPDTQKELKYLGSFTFSPESVNVCLKERT